MRPENFRKTLRELMPNGDLRLERDPHRLGINLWVIERRVPAAEHAAGLEELRAAGDERFIHFVQEGVGAWHYDCAPEWAIVSILRTPHCQREHAIPQFSAHDTDCYREPDMQDIAELHQWLHEFRDFEHSRRELMREHREEQAQIEKDASFVLSKEVKSSKDFRQLVYSFADDGAKSTTERIIIP